MESAAFLHAANLKTALAFSVWRGNKSSNEFIQWDGVTLATPELCFYTSTLKNLISVHLNSLLPVITLRHSDNSALRRDLNTQSPVLFFMCPCNLNDLNLFCNWLLVLYLSSISLSLFCHIIQAASLSVTKHNASLGTTSHYLGITSIGLEKVIFLYL